MSSLAERLRDVEQAERVLRAADLALTFSRAEAQAPSLTHAARVWSVPVALEQAAARAARVVAARLGLQRLPEIRWVRGRPGDPRGQLTPEGVVLLHAGMTPTEVPEVVAHELRHVWQAQHGIPGDEADAAAFARELRGLA